MTFALREAIAEDANHAFTGFAAEQLRLSDLMTDYMPSDSQVFDSLIAKGLMRDSERHWYEQVLTTRRAMFALSSLWEEEGRGC